MNPIIQYKNLLNKYQDPEAKKVQAFYESHASDANFVRQAKVLTKLFQLKKELAV